MNKIVRIAVIGNENSGKTTLISALTKIYDKYIPVEKLGKVKKSKSKLKYSYSETEININNDKFIFYEFNDYKDYERCAFQVDIKFDAAIVLASCEIGVNPPLQDMIKIINRQGLNIFPGLITWMDYSEDDIDEFIEFDLTENILGKGVEAYPEKIFRVSLTRALNDSEEDINTLKELIDYISDNIVEQEQRLAKEFLVCLYQLTEEEGGTSNLLEFRQKIECCVGNESSKGMIELYTEADDRLSPGTYQDVDIILDNSLEVERYENVVIKINKKIIGEGIIRHIY